MEPQEYKPYKSDVTPVSVLISKLLDLVLLAQDPNTQLSKDFVVLLAHVSTNLAEYDTCTQRILARAGLLFLMREIIWNTRLGIACHRDSIASVDALEHVWKTDNHEIIKQYLEIRSKITLRD